MANIELAIKIDEGDYKKLTKYGEPLPCGNLFCDGIMKAVANGTPLPKECDIQRIIPKRVNILILTKKFIYAKCPNPKCNHELSTPHSDGYYTIKHRPNFCPNCGQALLWESEALKYDRN